MIEEIETPNFLEIIEEPKKKKTGRPIKQNYDFFSPNKKRLLQDKRQYSGEHIHRIIRYRIVYEGQEYLFSTLNQVQLEFNITYCAVNKLLECYIKMQKGDELSKYESKIVNSYSKITEFIKLPVDRKKKIIGVIRPGMDTTLNLNLNIDIPEQ